jgi:hypothetical protein
MERGKPLGEPFKVTDFESPRGMVSADIYHLDISVSEQRLVLHIVEVSGSVWMLDNVNR